jgi:hypothetical protein
MGREAPCTLRFGERVGEGTAYLDTEGLVLCQERRLAVPVSELTVGETADGRVEVSFPGGVAVLHLDGAAQRWTDSLNRGPRGRLDRLGVKPGQCIGVVGPVEDGFAEELRSRAAVVVTGRSVPAGADIIFLGATQREELGRIPGLAHCLSSGGVLWVIRPRSGREITGQDVAVSGKAAGLLVGRPQRFSPSHTADRLRAARVSARAAVR